MPKTKQLPLQINEEQLMFYQEHSLGITQFAAMEQQLASLVAAGVDDVSAAAVRTAFFGIESFRAKLEFADRYIQLRLEGEEALQTAWSKVMKACELANSWRNKIVHYNQITYTQGVPGERVVLVPPPMSPSRRLQNTNPPSKRDQAPSYAISVRKLVEIRYLIFEAAMKVDSFRRLAASQKDLHEGRTPLAVPTLAHLIEEQRDHMKIVAGPLFASSNEQPDV